MDEESIIQTAQNGDIDAFNELVLRYQDIAYTQALWILNDPEEAEDCTQDSFIKAFERLSTFRRGSFKSWLMRIVINTCLDEIRRRRRIDFVSLTPQGEDGEERDFSELLADPSVPVDEQVERSELRSTLRRCMDELRQDHKEILILIDVLELDYHEAAQALGVPIGTVKSRLARGRWHLRNRIMGIPELVSKWAPAGLAT
jgi:RNA polymerase sigma-70 factor, ECF subfamily